MLDNTKISLPSSTIIKKHCINALSQYWPNNLDLINQLPVINRSSNIEFKSSLQLEPICLPEWAAECGVDGYILVPIECLPNKNTCSKEDLWKHVDWFLAVFLLLECWHERLWEEQFGPIHSYSFHLKDWDERVWQHAWVNRIGLFFREWSANINNKDSESIFGLLPILKINMTHDVDAIKKTLPIRLKQSVFIMFNSLRALIKGNFKIAATKLKKAFKFFVSSDDWMVFDKLLREEKDSEVISTFHFYADLRRRTLKRWLIDPGYKINSNEVKNILSKLTNGNHEIGLHPGFESWNDVKSLLAQKKALESASGKSVTAVRQHWLRFGWRQTWVAQEEAGLKLDTTLMFNDRPGFRNSSLIRWNPWNPETGNSFKLEALPSILMDSHLYDYLELNDYERNKEMYSWIKECQDVSGEVAVLWHPHTLSNDYGWSKGFTEILKPIKHSQIN